MPLDVAIYSQKDIIETYKNIKATESEKDVILMFISELTGLSFDALLSMADN